MTTTLAPQAGRGAGTWGLPTAAERAAGLGRATATLPPARLLRLARRLDRDRDAARERLAALHRELGEVVAHRDLSDAYDPHTPQGSTWDAEHAVSAAAGARVALAQAEGALRRIAQGSYGRCEACRGAIALARLEALPSAGLCLACASARRRP